MGYSAGGFVAARALELLPAGVQVDSAALLSSAVSPWRDLRPACRAVRGRLLVSASVGDCWVLGAGTTLFGNADGVHSPGLGMLGYLGPPDRKIVQVHWRPRMLRQGLLGLHDWSMLPAFIAGAAAGILGLAATARKETVNVEEY
jgi:pimeloyl-ACP methyl ester carboxylesterase